MTEQTKRAERQTHEDCEHLHKALEDVQSRLAPPQRDSTFPGAQAPVLLDPRDQTPDAPDHVHEEIRNLEQALRDVGCDPTSDWRSPGTDEEGNAIPRSQFLDKERITPDEQDQREMMLRQMAESRDKLADDDTDMPDEDDTVGMPVEEELTRMDQGKRTAPREQR